jgi:ketosteroid isomerase-like protein
VKPIVMLTIAAMFAAYTAHGQPSGRHVQEEGRVRGVLDAFYAAVDRRDWAAVEATLAGDFEFYSDDALVLRRNEFIKAMKDDDMVVTRLELDPIVIEAPAGSSIAWAKYHARVESRIRGKPHNVATVETVVFRKGEDSRWKMIHNHASIKRLGSANAATGG